MGCLSTRLALFLVLVLVTGFSCQESKFAEARPLSFLPQQRYPKILATLGVVCECCDGAGGECNSSWDESCSNLQCLPWKQPRR